MSAHEIKTLRVGEKGYPLLLAKITDPPKELYCRGNLELLNTPCLGIVGTRNITPYGSQAAEYFAGQIASAGFTVVSGLAYGVDTVAHRATLDVGGKTIAVLGTGIENISPKANVPLADNILRKDGLIISEYPGITPGADWTFPARNRIISGLSKGVVVIEADKRSGALITARSALDQNRDVFAVPGNIFSPRSVGPNLLIQEGAKLALSPQDVLEEYPSQAELFKDGKTTISTIADPVQQKIVAILNDNGPTHLDTIITKTEMPAAQVIAAVSILEIRGRITHTGNGIYKA